MTMRFVVGLAVSVLALGCSAEFCDIVACDGAGGAGGDGVGGGGGGIPAGCLPSEIGEGPVPPGCGVFLSEGGDDRNSGAIDAPVRSLAAATTLAAQGQRAIYACEGDYDGGATLPPGVSLFGGYDCGSWQLVAAGRTRIHGPADAPALTVAAQPTDERVMLQQLAVDAPKAVANGASSIALVVDAAAVDIVDCELVAREAKNGAPGSESGLVPDDGQVGVAGPGCAVATAAPGGNGGCDGLIVDGGNGGKVDFPPQPGKGDSPGAAGGAGLCSGPGAGKPGADGMPGMPSAAAASDDFGALAASGFLGAVGVEATDGGNGSGGGGGRAGISAGCVEGTGGGSGGGAGCKGIAGGNGGPGGSSFALVSIGADVALSNVTLTAGAAGAGGRGGFGQLGGDGQLGGTGTDAGTDDEDGCPGGRGGNGGTGGAGAGGDGGHSAPIAHTGAAPTGVDPAKLNGGDQAGELGLGGAFPEQAPAGKAGLSCPGALDISDGTCA